MQSSNNVLSHQNPPNVLVVDDDPVFVASAIARLRRAGWRARGVNDGLEALEAFDIERFDIALIDLTMPRIDGLRLIAMVRSTPRFRHLGLIVVSGTSDQDLLEDASKQGVLATFTKPVDWDKLLQTIAMHGGVQVPSRRDIPSMWRWR